MNLLVAPLAALLLAPAPPAPPAKSGDAAAIVPKIAPATIDDTLEVTGESLAARQIETRMTVRVMLNGRGPYRFLVDSGADRSAVGSAVARQLALPQGGRVTLRGTAGSGRVDTVKLRRLEVGRSVREDLSVPVLSEANLGAQGLLGIDALAGQRVMLDFDGKTITVQDTRRPPPASYGSEEIVITARRRNGQLILTEASVGRTRLSAVIDTGAQVTIGNAALHAAVFRNRRRPPAAVPVTLVSVTGQTTSADLVVLPEIRIGGLTLRDVAVAFADVPPFTLFGLADQPAVLLGTDVLEIFRRVSLDFKNRKIRFLLRR